MPKQAVDNLVLIAKDVIDPSFEAMNWGDYGAVCRMASESLRENADNFNKPKPRSYRDENGHIRFGFAGLVKPPEDIIEDDKHLEFDL